MFSLFKKKMPFTGEENARIIAAIRDAEKTTSGEIRIYVEPHNPLVDPLERAGLIFFKLKMDETKDRNGVLIYMAIRDKELALYGDKGIHEQVGKEYWDNEVKLMLRHFKDNHLVDGILACINDIGQTLQQKFPYNSREDKNELPDEIIFGK